jgi:prephenate dehydrogenase
MRVAIVGTGLIGGSLGLALRRLPLIDEVVACDAMPGRAEEAVARGAADRAAASPEEAGEGTELIVVATPVAAVADAACLSASRSAEGVIVTDVGSVKARVVEEVERRLPPHARFVGGHPMAGSEQTGLAAADGALFDGAVWVLTLTSRTDAAAFATVRQLLGSIGAHVVALDPLHHDRQVAVVSHLPHLAAGALLHVASRRSLETEGLFSLAAGGFRDMTRVSSGPSGIWLDICEENSAAIVEAIDAYVSDLARIRDAIAQDNRGEIRHLLEEARVARNRIPAKAGVVPSSLVEITLPIPDRPGVMAEVLTLVSAEGTNVEDVQIVHSAEGGQGLLSLVVAVGERAERARASLERAGYSARIRDL